MEEYKTKRIRYVEVAKDIYAAITPSDGLDMPCSLHQEKKDLRVCV